MEDINKQRDKAIVVLKNAMEKNNNNEGYKLAVMLINRKYDVNQDLSQKSQLHTITNHGQPEGEEQDLPKLAKLKTFEINDSIKQQIDSISKLKESITKQKQQHEKRVQSSLKKQVQKLEQSKGMLKCKKGEDHSKAIEGMKLKCKAQKQRREDKKFLEKCQPDPEKEQEKAIKCKLLEKKVESSSQKCDIVPTAPKE